MAETVKIHGLDGVRKALKRLPREVRKKELQKALRPGGNIIRDAARALAPKGEGFFRLLRGKEWAHYSGTLANSIVVRAEKKKFSKGDTKMRVGVLHDNKNPNVGAWYWRFVEFGTSKMPARPFLVTGFEISKFAANDAIKRALLKGVERQAKRVRSK